MKQDKTRDKTFLADSGLNLQPAGCYSGVETYMEAESGRQDTRSNNPALFDECAARGHFLEFTFPGGIVCGCGYDCDIGYPDLGPPPPPTERWLQVAEERHPGYLESLAKGERPYHVTL